MMRRVRALLRRLRSGWRLLRLGFDRRREVGWRQAAVRGARRLAEGREAAEQPPASGAEFDVIYAIGYWPGTPKRYRVFNLAEGLRDAGYRVHIMPFEQLDDIRRYCWQARALVLFRAEYDRLVGIAGVLTYARAAGIRIVYDIDDLVFDPGLADRMDGLRYLGRYERRDFIRSMARLKKLLLEADLVTVSTAALAQRVAALGRPCAVIPNSLNGEQLRVAAEIAATGRGPHDGVRIAYLSGTRTHQRDFAECEAALYGVLAEHPEVRFRAVGYLDLGPDWQRYGDRVERVGLLSMEDMLRYLVDVDINLAPLELGNPFCEAKSELKFFEAALVGVPTVASATQTFAAAIEHDVSGFVVRDAAEWRQALEALVTSPARRDAVGAAAQERALARYRLAAITPLAVAALGLRRPPARGSVEPVPVASGILNAAR